ASTPPRGRMPVGRISRAAPVRDSCHAWGRAPTGPSPRCRILAGSLGFRPMATPPVKLVVCDFPATTGLPGWSSFSPFVLEVDRALGLAKLPFERHHVNIMKLKELNPKGQLPVLMVGDEKVADSTRILHKIEELAPGSMTGGLAPAAVAEAWL